MNQINVLEKELHPFLAYHAKLNLKAYVKTIRHFKSKREYSEWLHPDMVGCYFPIGEWNDLVIDFGTAIASISIKLFAFELKRELNFSNLRQSFFQAVSNCSWANEGYLVAAKIASNEDFLDELKRLSTSFGIGVINLNLTDPDLSELLFPARAREVLDWDTINKLTINQDFEDFLKRVTIDIKSKEIRKEQYDPVLDKEDLLKSVRRNQHTERDKNHSDTKEKDVRETYSNTVIDSFTFDGQEREVKYWNDVLVSVSEIMLERHQDQFHRVLDLRGTTRPYFTKNPNELREPAQIDDTGIFVEKHLSANRTVRLSRYVMDLFGYSRNALTFHCKERE